MPKIRTALFDIGRIGSSQKQPLRSRKAQAMVVSTNRPPNARNGNGLPPSAVSDRQALIKTNLSRSLLLCQKEPPTPASLALMAGVWDDALRAIPTDWLDRAFSEALQAQRTPFPLTHAEVLTAWDNLLSERQRAATAPVDSRHLLPGGASNPCKMCHGAGRVVNGAQPVGHRQDAPCPRCQGSGRQPGFAEAAPTSYVGNMLIVFKTFCEEHRDPLLLPTRLKYALVTVKDGGRAGNFRDLLESTGQDTLYAALTALGIAVDPPPPAKPGTVGYWAKVGESF